MRIKHKGKVRFPLSSMISKCAQFEGCNSLSQHCDYSGKMGYGSYIGANSKISANIGRFTSIGPNCHTTFGRHPYTYPYATTSPMFYSLIKQNGYTYAEKQLFEENIYADPKHKIAVNIGNDCWINSNVTIISGVNVGDGAVLLAGAVITKDVPPYAIVGGVPAKIIKYRYSEADIKLLLESRWWNKSLTWIQEHKAAFLDFNHFITLVSR